MSASGPVGVLVDLVRPFQAGRSDRQSRETDRAASGLRPTGIASVSLGRPGGTRRNEASEASGRHDPPPGSTPSPAQARAALKRSRMRSWRRSRALGAWGDGEKASGERDTPSGGTRRRIGKKIRVDVPKALTRERAWLFSAIPRSQAVQARGNAARPATCRRTAGFLTSPDHVASSNSTDTSTTLPESPSHRVRTRYRAK